MICKTLVPLFLFVIAAQAFAQSPIGSAQVEGRAITIFDDFSWSFDTEIAATADDLTDCFRLESPQYFCGKSLGWQATTKISPAATGSFRLDDRNYALFVGEQLGSDDGITLDFMTSSIISNAAIGAGITEADVARFSQEDFDHQGRPARRLVYGAKVDGLNFIYFNTISIGKTEMVQFISFTIGQAPTDDATELHRKSFDAVRVIE